MSEESVLLADVQNNPLFEIFKQVFAEENIFYKAESLMDPQADWVISGRLKVDRYKVWVRKEDYLRAQKLWEDIQKSTPVVGE